MAEKKTEEQVQAEKAAAEKEAAEKAAAAEKEAAAKAAEKEAAAAEKKKSAKTATPKKAPFVLTAAISDASGTYRPDRKGDAQRFYEDMQERHGDNLQKHLDRLKAKGKIGPAAEED